MVSLDNSLFISRSDKQETSEREQVSVVGPVPGKHRARYEEHYDRPQCCHGPVGGALTSLDPRQDRNGERHYAQKESDQAQLG